MGKRKVCVFERVWPHGYGRDCVTKEIGHGVFHCWGSSYEELESGIGGYTVAIVEMPDGSVLTPDPADIKFLQGE